MSKPKILYIDDESININNFSMTYENEYEVLTTLSGHEALQIFEEHKDISVVIADQRMPQMTGVELLTTIYKADPDPVRIILTAYSDLDDIIQAVNEGHIYQYIQKPWDVEAVRVVLSRAVDRYKLVKENKALLEAMATTNEKLQVANQQLEEELVLKEKAEEKRITVQEKMLSQAKLASIGEIATGIVHELNQPLTYIQIMLQATARDIGRKRLKIKDLEIDVAEARNQVYRITKITDHLRTFGRSDTSQRLPLDLPVIIDNAMILFAKKLVVNNIGFETEYQDKLPQVTGNPTQLEQVFINLIQNAMDAMEGRDNKQIIVNFNHIDDDVVVVFEDNGPGIPDEAFRKIYEPYFTTKDEGKGTGLGLSIVFGVIKEHKGTIECKTKLDHGTTFTIKLPALPLDDHLY